jgi:hypothetical protein
MEKIYNNIIVREGIDGKFSVVLEHYLQPDDIVSLRHYDPRVQPSWIMLGYLTPWEKICGRKFMIIEREYSPDLRYVAQFVDD